MIRADSGETWKHVFAAVVSTSTDERSKFSLSAKKSVSLGYNRWYSSSSLPFFPEITAINQPLTLTVSANGSESNSPDTTQKLMAFGGKQV